MFHKFLPRFIIVLILRICNALSKAWFPPMRLTYSHVYSYENKYNLIGGNTLNNLKKNNLTIFREIIHIFS